ncbi:MAG TPA: ABC transporter permease [Terriglobales bacterium]|jgi:predicted permease
MSWRRLWNVARRQRRDREAQVEMADFLAREAEARQAAGAAKQEAARQAAIALGSAERWREEAREARGMPWLEIAGREMAMALRGLRRSPGLAIAAVLMLGLGIGATSAAFGLVERVLLQPLPYAQAQNLVKVQLTAPGAKLDNLLIGPADYLFFRDHSRAFQSLGIYQTDAASVRLSATPQKVASMDLTPDLLPTLGVEPRLGRTFSPADATPHAPLVVLLSDAFWRKQFGGDSSVVGRQTEVDGKPATIIGVMPAGFSVLDHTETLLYEPLGFDPAKVGLGNFSWNAIGRLRPGVTLAAANADANRMLALVMQTYPPPDGYSLATFAQARIASSLRPLKDAIIGSTARLLWMVLGSLGLVLVIVCANTAGLLLVRVEGRRHELAIRTALGASRSRMAALLVAESVWLGIFGGLLGLGVADAGLHALVAAAPQGLARLPEVHMDGWAVVFTLGLALGASLLLAIGPALRVERLAERPNLREAGRGLSASRARLRTRNALVVVQVALACVLLTAVGLMLRSAMALAQVNPGYDRSQPIAVVRISIPDADAPGARAEFAMQRRIFDALSALPGVSAGLASTAPMDGNRMMDPVYVQNRTPAGSSLPAVRVFHYISPGYLQAMGIPLLAGRDMTWQDAADLRPVAMVSAAFAREYWKTPAEALGHQIRVTGNDDWREIVGVAGDVHEQGLDQPAPAEVYWPLLAAHFEGSALNEPGGVIAVVRATNAGTAAFSAALRQAVWSVDRNIPLAATTTMAHYYDASLAQTRFTMSVLGLAAGMGLLVGIIGLYGVLAYAVAQRRRELGVRIALGAAPAGLMQAVVRQGLGLAALGTLLGLLAAGFAARLLASLLYGVLPGDPATFAAVALAMLAIAALASALPARTASRVSPLEALRAE